MSSEGKVRSILPIPDAQHVGVTTYDAKDPDTKYPADRAVAAAEGRAQCAHRAPRRRRLRRVERVRWPDPHADRRAPGQERPEVQPLPHDGAVLADAAGAADRPQSPLRQHGRHLRDRDRRRRATASVLPKNKAPLADDAQAQRLLDGAVRQVPRSAGLGDEPDGAVRPVADGRRRLRVLLRLHRRRDQPVVPGDLRRHDADRAGEDARRRATTSPRT